MAENNKTMALSPRQAFSGQRVRRISGSAMTIATWNVRSMYDTSKVTNIEREMLRLNIDILGISESKHKGVGISDRAETITYYSGNNTNTHYNGVAIMIKKQLKCNVINFLPLSDRVLLLQMRGKPRNINIVQVYAPTADSKNEEMEKFYDEVNKALKQLNSRDITLITGDFNSKVGSGSVSNVVGDYGLGVRNDRGERLVQFCQEREFVISNTCFKLPPRRLYTWKSPRDSPSKIIRNQIDFILVNRRYRNSIKSVKTYPGADVNSDHNPLIASMYCSMKILKTTAPKPKIDVTRLKDDLIRGKAHTQINQNIQTLSFALADSEDVEYISNHIRETLIETGKLILQPEPVVKKSCWVTSNILKLIEDRRSFKGIDDVKYQSINKQICKEVVEAKERWLIELCEDIEQVAAKHDWFNVHKKIKDITGGKLITNTHVLVDNNGHYAMSIEEKLKIWKAYIADLFSDSRPPLSLIDAEISGPIITRSEISYAIRTSKSGKSVGPDGVPVELVKLLEYSNLGLLEKLYNAIYDTGHIPTEWLNSIFVTLPKVPNAKKCSDYRTISLMSHVLKILLKVVHQRIYVKAENVISNTQFGFRNGLGTRDALFSYQVLVQRCWDVNQEVFVCFIDYEKSFDKISHSKLIIILEAIGLDFKDVRFIKNLYWNQKASVRVDGKLTDNVDILRGVRQGCILSPLLFNLYAESIFKEALEDLNTGILVNGKVINNIRYADDTILLAPSMDKLQLLLDRVQSVSAAYDLNINIKKTKYMIISKLPPPTTGLFCGGQRLESVQKHKYLGCFVDHQADHSLEIRCRIEQARGAFNKMRKLLCDRKLNIKLRTRLARCYIFSILLYGVEAWTLTETMCKKVEAFEMWVYRRMLRISWRDKISNEAVLQRMGKEVEVLNTIKRRKLEYLGHVMRNPKYELLQIVIQGKIQGKRSPGRRRTSWLKNLRQWYCKSTRSLFRAAVSRVQIAMMVANLR